MSPELYLGMKPGDLDAKPYAKYWNPDMKSVRKQVTDALFAGPLPEKQLLRLNFESAQQIQKQNDDEGANGFGFFPDGSAYVMVTTEMPGVSPEFIDWWFAWHSDEPERYKLWHPRAHVHAAWGEPAPPESASASNARLRYVGRPSHVWEYIGPELDFYRINFLAPSSIGLDERELADASKATAVCARVGFVRYPVDFGYLVHYVRATTDGATMHSHFWIGGPHIQTRSRWFAPACGLLRSLRKPRTIDAERLLIHCAEEMAHLATFLPALYREFA